MDPIILLVVIILLLVLVNYLPLEGNIKMILSIAIIIVALLIFLPGRLRAEELQKEKMADYVSTGLVLTNVGIEFGDSIHDKRFKCWMLENGLATGTNLIVKRLVRKQRPDKSNFHSFYSAHSQNALLNSGWKLQVSVPIAFSTGYLRTMAKKHDWIDVGVGLLAGFSFGRIC